MGDAVEIFEEERQSLAFVEARVMSEAAQAAITIFGHGNGEAAGQAEAFGHLVLGLGGSGGFEQG